MRALILDFDGVLVESLDIKTQAFADLFAGEPALPAILALHRANGGLSRFAKFEIIYRDILRRPLPTDEMDRLSRRFSELVVEQVVACPLVPGALEFLQEFSASRPLFIVSATPQAELQLIVARRGLAGYFRGVYGAPDSKTAVLRRLLEQHAWPPSEVLFVGDAINDWKAAAEAGLTFVGRVPAGASNPFPAEGVAALVPDLRALAGWLRQFATL
jgi:HAD superfamily hydrolase (TIGR01549 family)